MTRARRSERYRKVPARKDGYGCELHAQHALAMDGAHAEIARGGVRGHAWAKSCGAALRASSRSRQWQCSRDDRSAVTGALVNRFTGQILAARMPASISIKLPKEMPVGHPARGDRAQACPTAGTPSWKRAFNVGDCKHGGAYCVSYGIGSIAAGRVRMRHQHASKQSLQIHDCRGCGVGGRRTQFLSCSCDCFPIFAICVVRSVRSPMWIDSMDFG